MSWFLVSSYTKTVLPCCLYLVVKFTGNDLGTLWKGRPSFQEGDFIDLRTELRKEDLNSGHPEANI